MPGSENKSETSVPTENRTADSLSHLFLSPISQEQGDMSFQQWLDISPDALVVIDAHGQIVQVNSQVEAVFGYARTALIDQPLEKLLPERFHTAHRQHRQHYATSPRLRPMGAGLELYGRREDGSEVPVDISLSPLRFQDAFYVLAAIRDVTERRRLQERERTARAEAEVHLELLQLILDELPSAVALIQAEDARLVLANRAATALWGVPWPIGQPFYEFLAANHLSFLAPDGRILSPATLGTLRAVQYGETVREVQELIRRADGSSVPILVNAVTLGHGRFSRVPVDMRKEGAQTISHPLALVVYQDVTERVELERRKDEFIGMAGHELRTPVTSIKTYTQLVRRRLEKQDNDTCTEVLGRIDVQLGQLTRLISELLDITQMETGCLPWHEQMFALDTLIREIATDLARTTENHHIQLEGVTPLQIYGDRERIGQVLANLLSNAIKYMPQGGTICLAQEISPQWVQLSVEDHGIGIPQEKLAQVFERFYRVRDQAYETFPGLGLGLYLSAEIVRRQGGSIWVKSQEKVGSIFFFTLRREETLAGEPGREP